MYPYCPPHISRPKEVRRLFLIALPERCYLSVSAPAPVAPAVAQPGSALPCRAARMSCRCAIVILPYELLALSFAVGCLAFRQGGHVCCARHGPMCSRPELPHTWAPCGGIFEGGAARWPKGAGLWHVRSC